MVSMTDGALPRAAILQLRSLPRASTAKPQLESETFESAETFLGHSDSVTTVLAWNRTLRLDRSGDFTGTRTLLANSLLWLLGEARQSLDQGRTQSVRGSAAGCVNRPPD